MIEISSHHTCLRGDYRKHERSKMICFLNVLPYLKTHFRNVLKYENAEQQTLNSPINPSRIFPYVCLLSSHCGMNPSTKLFYFVYVRQKSLRPESFGFGTEGQTTECRGTKGRMDKKKILDRIASWCVSLIRKNLY